jgi:ABC-type glycerol-3-phosphate transport system permease component
MIAFQHAHNTNYPALLAGLSLISMPPLVIYLLLNRHIVRGLVAGAVK